MICCFEETKFQEGLRSLFKGHIMFDQKLSDYTTFKIGGKADIFFTPSNNDELSFFLSEIIEMNIEFVIIGGGSNILIADSGFKGAVIYTKKLNKFMLKSDTNIIAEAGTDLRKLVNFAWSKGLSGLEFAAGIPGTIGGALICNAGGKYGSIHEIVVSVTTMDKTGKTLLLTRDDLKFGYRESHLPENSIITNVEIQLEQGDIKSIRNRTRFILSQKANSQPLKAMSAGCIFKNIRGSSTGALIDSLHLKGFQIGDASISKIHANFIINEKEASASDILELIRFIKKEAQDKKNVELETEIKFIGFKNLC
jgi:UDP-N-acetylmuramate dehydrogenase